MIDTTSLHLSLESRPLYPLYYRRYGIRMPAQVMMPPINTIEELLLPLNSLYHAQPEDEAQYGPAQDEPVFRDQERLIMVEHITQLADQRGNPIPLRVPTGPMIRAYHRKNRKTRPLMNFQTANGNQRTLIVENYGLLPHLSRYLNNYFRPFNRWWNIQATIWDRIGKLHAQTMRQQYIIYRLPEVLPSLQQLQRAERKQTRQTLDPFRSPEAMFLLELWKWLGEHRAESVISKAGDITFDHINLIFQDENRWIMLNLGKMKQWIKSEDNPQAAFRPIQAQRRLLRLMMLLMEGRLEKQLNEAQPQDEKKEAPAQAPSSDTSKEPADKEAKEPTQKAETKAPAKEEVPSKTTAPVAVVKDETGKEKKLKLFREVDPEQLPDEHSNIQIDDAHVDQQIEEDLKALDKIQEKLETQLPEEDEHPMTSSNRTNMDVVEKIEYHETPKPVEQVIMSKVDQLAERGMVSAAEYRRFIELSQNYKKLPNPYNPQETIAKAVEISQEDLTLKDDKKDDAVKIADKPLVLDKSMLNDTLRTYDTRYIKKVMPKDIVGMVSHVQNAGLILTDYQIEKKKNAVGEFEEHRVQLTPIRGKVSTVTFTLPVVEEDGTFVAAGVKCRMRKTRRDVPIRKISPSRVALTSYYAKIFVNRSEKQANNYPGWLTNQIAAIGMDQNDTRVENMMLADVFDSTLHIPRIYSILSTRFRSFYTADYKFFFDYRARTSEFGEDVVKKAETADHVMIGQSRLNKTPVVVDKFGVLYEAGSDSLKQIGTFETLIGLNGKPPMEMVELKIFSKNLPLGVLLAYKLGFTELLKLLKANYRLVPEGERVSMTPDEYSIRFSDATFIFHRDDRIQAGILSGLAAQESFTRNYSSALFEKPDIYLRVLDNAGFGYRFLREFDLMTDMFIDPITKGILEEMKEPTTFIGLLLRACELLQTDWSPEETDMAYMRIVGYERFAGAVYGEMIKSLRMYRARTASVQAKVEMHPYAVWQAVTQDSSVKLVEDSNPINNVKEKEEVTFSGEGGRSARSMVARTRVFHPNDMGVISEATKDSSQVAITTYLSADPNIKSLRGLTTRYDPNKTGPASMVSSSVLHAPAADRDQMKRVGFISIQNSSSMAAVGYRPMPYRTGYEQVLAARTDELFASAARMDGEVVSVNDKAIVVKYDNGDTHSIQLGRRFGKAAALTLPHNLVTQFKAGQKFKKDDILAYNTDYFEPDPLNPGNALFKFGALFTVALMESPDTLEDSCAISLQASEKMASRLTEQRNIVVSFTDNVHQLIPVGTKVNVEDPLCVIEDAITAQSRLFDDASVSVLKNLAASSPKAKFTGVVEKIEVYYHGDIDDMSETLQEITLESERERKRQARELKTDYISGRVDGALRVDGNPLMPNQAVIRVYITGTAGFGVGDKAVFGNQLKTICGRVMTGRNETEHGEPIDAIFGYLSVSDRIVRSPEIMGTTNKLMELITEKAIAAYRKGK